MYSRADSGIRRFDPESTLAEFDKDAASNCSRGSSAEDRGVCCECDAPGEPDLHRHNSLKLRYIKT